MKFYIPSSERYIEFSISNGALVTGVYEPNGTQVPIPESVYDSNIEVFELISLGKVLEVYRQIQEGLREYDPYAIFPKDMKKEKLQ